MFKKIFSLTVPTMMLTLLLINPGFIALQSGAQSPVSSRRRTLHQDHQNPAGLSASDWNQIRALMEQQNPLAAISPQGISFAIQKAYLKSSNTGVRDRFGSSIAASGDTVVVGAYFESSNATGVNGNQTDNSAEGAGAAYWFNRAGAT